MMRYIFLLAVIAVFIIDLFQVVGASDKLEHYRRSVDEYNQEQAMMAKNIVFMELGKVRFNRQLCVLVAT
ncbi:hypothetical protein [Phytobacter sp. V91]|uniref:hypothetical protein n=1 Tax=Phytobacter sp. V91 TaxID=3369425 RepID=UPI003F634F16